MNRRKFIRTSSIGLGALAWGRASHVWPEAKSAKKPDVLFIMIEGTPPSRLGTWGNPICKTPNLDRLASQGLRFDLAQCMAPPCNPARTSLLLGLRPESTKTFSNRTDWRPLHPNIVTMPQHFRKNGYETIECGKIFHGAFETRESWDRIIAPTEGLPAPTHKRRALVGPDAASAEAMRKIKRQGKGKAKAAAKKAGAAVSEDDGQAGGVPFVYGPTGLDDLEEHDGMVAEQGVRVLGQKHDKPLFLALGFTRPHLPYACPDKYFAMYPPEKITLPENPVDVPKSRDQRLVNDATWREAIAAFYASLTFADTCIGRVLDALDKSGRADNTVVVFMADHGYMLGEHYQWRKGQLYEEGVTVPMIMKVPGVTKPGSICKRPVEFIDVFPTLFDVCGIPQPPGIEAISMKPLLENPSRQWKKGAITVQGGPANGTIRTDRWRYWEYGAKGGGQIGVRSGVALFDHQTDPGEFVNLAKDPKCKDVVAELHGLLQGGWKACLPPE